MTAANSEALRFQTSRTFQFLYLLPVLLLVALLADLVVGGSAPSWPLIAGALLLALFTVPRALARAELADNRLILSTPLRAPRSIDLRQLVSYERSGRIGHSLILRYRPADEQGRQDVDNEQFLGLPPLDRQFELEERLDAAVQS